MPQSDVISDGVSEPILALFDPLDQHIGVKLSHNRHTRSPPTLKSGAMFLEVKQNLWRTVTDKYIYKNTNRYQETGIFARVNLYTD